MIKVAELFAGVGGFRAGLSKHKEYTIVWSNQWEPSTKSQPASDIYTAKFGFANHSNEDIAEVIQHNFDSIPDHDLLVGGFPCQDYSVARTLNKATGIKGAKGVLWWSIHAILEKKKNKRPNYLMLENVDRLLKSPTTQRGRDFAIMLSSLTDLGYIVEWRVINAADFGMPQRRKRVYIMAYKSGSPIYKHINNLPNIEDWITTNGVMQNAFPMGAINGNLLNAQLSFDNQEMERFDITGSLEDISEDRINYTSQNRPFKNVGIIRKEGKEKNRIVSTYNAMPEYHGKAMSLGDVLQEEEDISPDFYITPSDMERWLYLKGAKKEPRTTKAGFVYQYSEGPVAFPDSLDKPSRTIVTGEGGKSPSRFKHVVEVIPGKLRRLTPVELERLNGFEDNHTKGPTDAKRAFFMGNALVVDIVEELGKSLLNHHKK